MSNTWTTHTHTHTDTLTQLINCSSQSYSEDNPCTDAYSHTLHFSVVECYHISSSSVSVTCRVALDFSSTHVFFCFLFAGSYDPSVPWSQSDAPTRLRTTSVAATNLKSSPYLALLSNPWERMWVRECLRVENPSKSNTVKEVVSRGCYGLRGSTETRSPWLYLEM